jgi:tetratricopeptide (TPR) repeat protein/TolB-like protein
VVRTIRFWRIAGAFLAVVLLIYALAFTDAMQAVKRLIDRLSGQSQPPPVIVVLPFESATAEEDARNFASALDERLITELVQSGRSRVSFRVVPASEVRSFEVKSCADARKRLKADFVFGGTVRKEPASYWIMLALSDGSSCEQIRAEKVEVDRLHLPWLDADLRDKALKMLPERAKAASVIVASAQAFSNPRAYELTLEARGLLRRYAGKADVDAALSKLEEAVRVDPGSAEAWAWLAEARVQSWRITRERQTLELAEDAVRRAAALNRSLAAVRLAAGRVAHERGDWEKAISEYKAAMELNPEDSEIYRFAGRACSEAGKNREAEAYYRKAVEVAPDSWQAYSGLGRFLYQEKRFEEALEAYRRAAELFDESPMVHSGLGGAYYGLQRFDEAEREFRKSIDRRPNATAYTNLGSLLYEQRRYSEAAASFELAVALRPQDDAGWSFVGEACARVPGKQARSREAFLKAAELFTEALKVNPNDAERWGRLAVVKAYLGDAPGAREAVRRALQLRPNDENLLHWGARAEARLGNIGRAVELMTKSLEEGYPRDQALRDPDLEQARKDPRLRALLQ